MTMPPSSTPPYPSVPTSKQLNKYWTLPVRDIVQVTNTISDETKERHRIYSLLVMALVAAYWNGDSRGRAGKYHWRQRLGPHRTYLGHNIASIAVNHRGDVMAFDFNHNDIFNSSAEHAEARLVRHVFALASLDERDKLLRLPRPHGALGTYFNELWTRAVDGIEGWSDRQRAKKSKYPTALKDVTVYTSLESCAQCSGIMALAYVKEVVFLQEDPEQHCIGNILFNLMDRSQFPAPLPIPACHVDLDAFSELNLKYKYFTKHVQQRPFFTEKDGKKDCKPSITSFLCTDAAYRIFDDGRRQLKSMSCAFSSNQQALDNAQQYFRYAVNLGRRGTPYR